MSRPEVTCGVAGAWQASRSLHFMSVITQPATGALMSHVTEGEEVVTALRNWRELESVADGSDAALAQEIADSAQINARSSLLELRLLHERHVALLVIAWMTGAPGGHRYCTPRVAQERSWVSRQFVGAAAALPDCSSARCPVRVADHGPQGRYNLGRASVSMVSAPLPWCRRGWRLGA